MIRLAVNPKTKLRIVGLLTNVLLSWTVLPLVIPPFRFYSLRELGEVLLWQGIGSVGWPIAIVGGLGSLVLQSSLSNLAAVLIILIYPAMLLLLILVLFSERSRRWMLILLHALLVFSFAAIWYRVRNGYDFMTG